MFSFLKPYVNQHLIVLALEAQPAPGVWFHQRRDEMREHAVAHHDALYFERVFTDDNVHIGGAYDCRRSRLLFFRHPYLRGIASTSLAAWIAALSDASPR